MMVSIVDLFITRAETWNALCFLTCVLQCTYWSFEIFLCLFFTRLPPRLAVKESEHSCKALQVWLAESTREAAPGGSPGEWDPWSWEAGSCYRTVKGFWEIEMTIQWQWKSQWDLVSPGLISMKKPLFCFESSLTFNLTDPPFCELKWNLFKW